MIPDSELRRAYWPRSVLVTGHTGFVGRALVKALRDLGANVTGYSLPNDVRDFAGMRMAIEHDQPDYIFHLAAQAFVPVGWEKPRETMDVNAGGTVNLLEAIRLSRRAIPAVIVTTDKVYGEWEGLHIETDPLFGRCPYSASKVAAEHAVEAYRPLLSGPIATARAGNIIGPGDYGEGRLVPNAVKALREGRPIPVYHADAVRPWQGLNGIVDGYLRLGARLHDRRVLGDIESAFNFGPIEHHTVREIVERIIKEWGGGTWEKVRTDLREVSELRIDSSKARWLLSWTPTESIDDVIRDTVKWYKDHG